MKIIPRFFRFMILFLLILPCILLIFIQTSYAKGQIKKYIEKKTEGSLTVGEIKGILPFWVHLPDLHYQTDLLDVTLHQVKVAFSPLSLLKKRLSIVDLHIENAAIRSKNLNSGFSSSVSKNFLKFPYKAEIHRFTIQHLFYNDNQPIALQGAAELEDHFSLQASVHPQQFSKSFDVNLEADSQKGVIKILAQWKPSQGEVFLDGTYSWNSQNFSGNWLISLSEKSMSKNPVKGSVELDLHSMVGIAKGEFLDRPFFIQADLTSLSRPIQFHYGDEGRWNISGEYDFNHQALFYHLHALEMEWGKIIFPEILMDGSYSNDLLAFSLNLPEVYIQDPAYEILPHIKVHLTGNIPTENLMSGVVYSAEGTIEGLGPELFSFSFQIPLKTDFLSTGNIVDEEAPFKLHLLGKGSIDPILAVLENAAMIAHGDVDLNLQATGSWNHPEMSGYLNYHGSLECLETGSVFHDIRMEMQGVENSFKICSLTAKDVDQGHLTGSGALVWDPCNHFPFFCHILINHYLLLAADPLRIIADADLVIDGNLQGVSINGEAELREGIFTIPSELPIQIPCVEVSFVNPICPPPPEVPLKKIIPIHWDLLINANRNLHIEGRGLDSSWRGHLRITGEQRDFQFNGKLKLVQGRFHVINQTFDLVHGQIIIHGLKAPDIFIDMKGDYELPNLTASILVTGFLNSPQISFCSNPPMNTNQILSWILFQEDINELTPMQACRLATILVALSGTYSGPSTFEKIKDKLGIDVFSITDCDFDTADLTFQVGKYLSQGTFVGVNKSISGNFDSVLIQTRLIKHVYLEADYGGSLNGISPNGGKVILKWYKTY